MPPHHKIGPLFDEIIKPCLADLGGSQIFAVAIVGHRF